LVDFQQENIIERPNPRGGHPTKLVNFDNVTQLIMALPGAGAKETRQKFADILKRYTGGDASLIDEIHANAQSNSPLAQLARNSIAASAGSSLGNRGAGEPLTTAMTSSEFNKGINAVLAVVVTNERMNQIDAKNKEWTDAMDKDVIFIKEEVAKCNDNKKEVATLTELAKTSALNAKKQEEIAAKVAGGVGAAAAKRYKRLRDATVAAEKRIDVLARQQGDIKSAQDDLKAAQADIKAGQAAILGLLMAMQPQP